MPEEEKGEQCSTTNRHRHDSERKQKQTSGNHLIVLLQQSTITPPAHLCVAVGVDAKFRIPRTSFFVGILRTTVAVTMAVTVAVTVTVTVTVAVTVTVTVTVFGFGTSEPGINIRSG